MRRTRVEEKKERRDPYARWGQKNREIGRKEGFEEGRDVGFKEGYEQAEKECQERGKSSRVKDELIRLLFEAVMKEEE